jgi:hypothetical protein
LNILFLIASHLNKDNKLREGLRMIASFIGMDQFPSIVFLDQAIEALLTVNDNDVFYEYLTVAADLVGIKVLRESVKTSNLNLSDFDPRLNLDYVDFGEVARIIVESDFVVCF